MIRNCSFDNYPGVRAIIEIQECVENSKDLVRVTMRNVSFIENRNYVSSAGFHFYDPDCYELVLEAVSFLSNESHGFSSLAKRNNITELYIFKARNSWSIGSIFFLFLAPEGSETNITNLTAFENILSLVKIERADITIKDSTIENNSFGNGRAIIGLDSDIKVYNSLFRSNTCQYEGSVFYIEYGVFFVSNSTFVNNTASEGGAIYYRGEGIELANVTFDGNKANIGGAVFSVFTTEIRSDVDYRPIIRVTTSFTQSQFTNNRAIQNGGAFFAVYALQTVQMNFTGNSFVNNTASRGGNDVAFQSNLRHSVSRWRLFSNRYRLFIVIW